MSEPGFVPRQREPGGVRAVALHPVQRVDAVALGLRHLLAELVTDQTVQEDVVERLHVVHRVQAEHHHPDDPEEQDVVAGR
jgi:hypothetical protein